MKLVIAGSRNITPSPALIEHMLMWYGIVPENTPFDEIPNLLEVVSGGAAGVDKQGELYGEIYECKITRYVADWDKHGKAAGFIRNKEMAKYADAALVIWDGESKGSANMIKCMKELNKPVYECILKESC